MMGSCPLSQQGRYTRYLLGIEAGPYVGIFRTVIAEPSQSISGTGPSAPTGRILKRPLVARGRFLFCPERRHHCSSAGPSCSSTMRSIDCARSASAWLNAASERSRRGSARWPDWPDQSSLQSPHRAAACSVQTWQWATRLMGPNLGI